MAQTNESADNAAPSDEADDWDDELIPDHEYDGIREYDNPIPGWLSLLMWGTIIWSLYYLVAINLGYISGWHESYEANRAAIAEKRAEAEAAAGEMNRETIVEAVGDSERIEAGRQVYSNNCSACHGDKGGGDVGPNLTDDSWLHGGKLVAIHETIAEGVTDKGMPAWKDQLSPEDIVSTVAYIRSIRGTAPPDAEDPEGEKYVPNQ